MGVEVRDTRHIKVGQVSVKRNGQPIVIQLSVSSERREEGKREKNGRKG